MTATRIWRSTTSSELMKLLAASSNGSCAVPLGRRGVVPGEEISCQPRTPSHSFDLGVAGTTNQAQSHTIHRDRAAAFRS